MSEQVSYGYGIEGLDCLKGDQNISPATVPGAVTVVTGVSGSGISTFLANVALGLARSKRSCCIGSMDRSFNLERLACISLAVPRDCNSGEVVGRMAAIRRYVDFVDNQSPANLTNLSVLENVIAASKCEVFVLDADRIFNAKPVKEAQILYRLADEARRRNFHLILTRRQRIHAMDSRRKGMPSLDGIAGTSTWLDVADTILGVHRPGVWKSGIEDDKLDVFVLKQRLGKWPFLIRFDADFRIGTISGGRLSACTDDSVFSPPKRPKPRN